MGCSSASNFLKTISSGLLMVPFIALWSTLVAQESPYSLSGQKLSEQKRRVTASRKKQAKRINDYGYEVTYHRLRLQLFPAQDTLKGTVNTHFTVKKSNLQTLKFDFDQRLQVDSIIQSGRPLNYQVKKEDQLVVNLPDQLSVGGRDSLTIAYHRVRKAGFTNGYTQSTHANKPALWTLSQPYSAKNWWPCKQSLTDKIDSIDVYATTSNQYRVVSNGQLVNQTTKGAETIYHWQHRYPIATYLVAVAVTNYKRHVDSISTQSRDHLPLVSYVYPETEQQDLNDLAFTRKVFPYFEQLLGPYPFSGEQYGHVKTPMGGAMEHQTMSFMGDLSKPFIAHELAHQWFGNKITCGSWRDIWLNEGFATYFEALAIQKLEGENAFRGFLSSLVDAAKKARGGTIYTPENPEANRIFNYGLSYAKGAMVLRTLRLQMGDSAFRKGIRKYLQAPDLQYQQATTPDFRRIMASVTDQPLKAFFDDWIYEGGFPNYKVNWANKPDGGVLIKVEQSRLHSSAGPFNLERVPFRIEGSKNQDTTLYLPITEAQHQFDVDQIPFKEAENIQVDPRQRILSSSQVTFSPAIIGDTTASQTGLKVEVQPNPFRARTTITIQAPEIPSVSLYNLNGKRVQTFLLNQPTQEEKKATFQLTLNGNRIRPGIYLLKVQVNGEQKIRKMLIQ